MHKYLLFSLLLGLAWAGCDQPDNSTPLPILGNRDISPAGDTVYPKVPDFKFTNQDGQPVTNATVAGKAYVVDFFFIHCPTICPKVKAQALRIYEKYRNDDRLVLLSHSIDTRNDTVPALKRYADKLGVQAPKWQLVTGEKDAIYSIADDYFSVAQENPDAPGGFDHSGRLILVDTNRHVRAFCDGTDAEDVTKFLSSIDRLLKEMGGK
jgi:protein SCO1